MSDSYHDRMYPVGNMTLPFSIEGKDYPVEVRPPKWIEYVEAESRALAALKNVMTHPVDENGIPQPPPPGERQMLAVQTGIELARVCILKVGDAETKEEGFWDRQHPKDLIALGQLMVAVVWDSGVGRKNSQPPAAQPATSGPASKP